MIRKIWRIIGLICWLPLVGCAGVEAKVTSGLTTLSTDTIAAGKTAICFSSYQVVASAEVADPKGMGVAVPALCPVLTPAAVQPPPVVVTSP